RNITQSQNALGLPIGTVAGLMSLCDLYIGNDTGPMHLAASVGTTCVAIFSARAPRGHWYPLGEKHLIFRDDIDCAGCHFQTCDVRKLECLDFIQPQDVLNACSNLLTKNISSRG
ncbi:MAG: glycosyltransferase family 9 protein, partial [Deltaproteobacteria bacterium]